MSDFTPGPWKIVDYKGGVFIAANLGYSENDPGDDLIAGIEGNKEHPENKANARLIAAAPAMYEALREIAYTTIMGQTALSAYQEMKEIAKAATALAEGESDD